jgi:hypothetical protein
LSHAPAALDDEFCLGWWMSETLMADAQASFVIGEWEDAVPSVIAGGQAAEEKGNLLLVSQSLAYRRSSRQRRGIIGPRASWSLPSPSRRRALS